MLDLDSKSAVLKFTVKSSIYKPMQIRGCKTCSSKSAVLKFTVESLK